MHPQTEYQVTTSSNPASDIVTAALEAPLPTPSYDATKGTFSVLTKVVINAPADTCLRVVRDTESWPFWNPFTPSGSVDQSHTISFSNDLAPICACPSTEPHICKHLYPFTILKESVHLSGDGLIPGSKLDRYQTVEVTTLDQISGSEDPDSNSNSDSKSQNVLRIAWKGKGFPGWALWSERVMEFKPIARESGEREGNECMATEHVCWETFGGLLAPVVKWKVGDVLVRRFGDHSAGLKDFCEKKASQAEHGAGGV